MSTNDVFRRCGCRDDTGKQYGARCPKLDDPKHGTWAFYLAAGIDPKTGRRRQIRQAGFATKQAAQKARNEAAVKVDKGNYIAPTRELYADYLRRWLPKHTTSGEGLRDTTVAHYRRYIDNDLIPSALGRMQLTDIRRFHVSALVDELVAAGRGATTIRRIAAVIQGSLRAAFEDGLIESNPTTGVKLPKVERKEFEAWSPAEVGHFLDVAAGHRLGALFELAMLTGLRRGELLGLRWTDVDMARRTLTVRHNRTQAGDRVVESAPKTRSGRRVVELGDRAAGALIAWQIAQAAEAAAWGEARADGSYVFTYEDGQPLKPQYATRLFEKMRLRAGLPKLTFHGQRHEAASLMIEAGEDILVVSRILGHSSVDITGDIYGHLFESKGRRAADSAAALVPPRKADAHTLHTQADSPEATKAPASATSA